MRQILKALCACVFRGVSLVEACEGASEVTRVLVAQRERGLLDCGGLLGQQVGGSLHFQIQKHSRGRHARLLEKKAL
jgi:hypothetical protein